MTKRTGPFRCALQNRALGGPPDRRSAVQRRRSDYARPRFASEDLLGGTSEEKGAAADTYIAYCGTYELFDDHVVHHVEQSFFPNRVGTAQTRYYRLEGDRIELTTPPILIDGEEQVCRISWERAR